ncbi:DMT family transporter [Paludibacterium denitrificans]|uniref:DMT family transporter n=1 Tax=Paludibacterium denitrificans TaxID=2675226 RepID=UPI001E506BC1|nr:DMT family transporter [Paludibacterium denitrificans]
MTDQKKAYLFGLSAVLAWSTVATAFKLSLSYLSPAQLLLYASLASLLSLCGVLAATGKLPLLWPTLRQHWRRSLLLGAVNPFIYYLILFKAYALLPAQEAQSINYTWALTMTLLAVPLLKQALRLRRYRGSTDLLSRGTGYRHAWRIIVPAFFQHAGRGLCLGFDTVVGYWIANTRDQRDPLVGLTLNFALSLPLSLVWCAVTGQLTSVAWQGIAGAAYVGALEMGFTFALWLTAMKLTRHTASIANLIFLSPLLSLGLIHLIVGEAILPSTLLGLGLILTGLLIQKCWQRGR